MSNIIPLNARSFLAPGYWPLWLAFGLLRLISMLPLRWTQALGAGIGLLEAGRDKTIVVPGDRLKPLVLSLSKSNASLIQAYS